MHSLGCRVIPPRDPARIAATAILDIGIAGQQKHTAGSYVTFVPTNIWLIAYSESVEFVAMHPALQPCALNNLLLFYYFLILFIALAYC